MSGLPFMRSLFDYSDYRAFLADYFAFQKERKPSFSYRSFSNRAGFKSRDFIYKVIHGKKNLSQSSIVMVALAMGLGKKETEYFEALVGFNQAKNHRERDFHYEKMVHLNRNRVSVVEDRSMITPEHYAFFSEWYHTAVRSLVDLVPFSGDYVDLAKKLYPAITPSQARKSIALLKKIGFIVRQKNGTWTINQKALKTGEEVRKHAMDGLFKSFMGLAERALEEVPRERRNMSGLTLGISAAAYEEIVEKIQKFRAEIAGIADRDDAADRVYQLNLQLFPLSKIAYDKKQ
jgi:uncharacterized protein (TIGR02147 family)